MPGKVGLAGQLARGDTGRAPVVNAVRRDHAARLCGTAPDSRWGCAGRSPMVREDELRRPVKKARVPAYRKSLLQISSQSRYPFDVRRRIPLSMSASSSLSNQRTVFP